MFLVDKSKTKRIEETISIYAKTKYIYAKKSDYGFFFIYKNGWLRKSLQCFYLLCKQAVKINVR